MLRGSFIKVKILSDVSFGDTTARYLIDAASRVGLVLFPSASIGQLATRRATLAGVAEIETIPDSVPPAAIGVDSLVQLKIVGDPYPGAFAQGRTMRQSPSIGRFQYSHQQTSRDGDRTTLTTFLAATDGLRLEHRLSWRESVGRAAAEVRTRFINGSSQPVTLEMLSSFSLSGMTPFDVADAPGRLRVHRFRSVWSAEGRLDTQSVEQLHLERSWSGSGLFSERFGQVGSMPVRGFFPFVAVEDMQAKVLWGAQLAWAGSWQMEIFREDDQLCISGGLADREFGHWTKTLAPGESLTTPPATIACAQGDLDDLCDRLIAAQEIAVDLHPEIERELPIVFNEWCTTWGDPSHERVLAIARRLQNSQVRYFVIDAGWYKNETGSWNDGHGDWQPSKKLFPDGLAVTASAIRELGLIPGLWFEFETVGQNSAAFSVVDHLLQRDGMPVTVRSRRFWDLRDPFAVKYLATHVIDLLERCNFGYLKVDYNETIGIGCEGAESLGEGLRQHIEGVYRFFDLIRSRLPNLVIENCSSGGHRLEPSMLGRTAMSSFSDAHELREIPLIAANLHRLMLPRQSQIWAVLHRNDTDARLIYSLAATFLGRMCLSGEIDQLTADQWQHVTEAQNLYRAAAPIIAHGISRRFGSFGESWRHPSGWQAMRRVDPSGQTALVVLHTFAQSPSGVEVPLPAGRGWEISSRLGVGGSARVQQDTLLIQPGGDFQGQVLLLTARKTGG